MKKAHLNFKINITTEPVVEIPIVEDENSDLGFDMTYRLTMIVIGVSLLIFFSMILLIASTMGGGHT